MKNTVCTALTTNEDCKQVVRGGWIVTATFIATLFWPPGINIVFLEMPLQDLTLPLYSRCPSGSLWWSHILPAVLWHSFCEWLQWAVCGCDEQMSQMRRTKVGRHGDDASVNGRQRAPTTTKKSVSSLMHHSLSYQLDLLCSTLCSWRYLARLLPILVNTDYIGRGRGYCICRYVCM